ncbi:MAG: hypothetical protein EXR05_00055 [Acetobacteraceae bacterium]|nr:hypothetical protein [Acetobacteraceae bacterium]
MIICADHAGDAVEEFMAGRVMIASCRTPTRAALADPSVPMKTIATGGTVQA